MGKFMNAKQFRITITLVALMIILACGEIMFNDKIKNVALTSNNINDLSDYSILDGAMMYKLPDNWQVEEKQYPGDYILHNNSFVSEDMGIIGYVQIVSSDSTIENLIKTDKSKLKENKISEYQTSIEKIEGKPVNKVSYKEKNDSGKTYLNVVYYRKISEKESLKVLFSCSDDKYKDNYDTVYNTIIKSFTNNK